MAITVKNIQKSNLFCRTKHKFASKHFLQCLSGQFVAKSTTNSTKNDEKCNTKNKSSRNYFKPPELPVLCAIVIHIRQRISTKIGVPTWIFLILLKRKNFYSIHIHMKFNKKTAKAHQRDPSFFTAKISIVIQVHSNTSTLNYGHVKVVKSSISSMVGIFYVKKGSNCYL